MTLTVIIPTRDRARQLRGAIESVIASPLVRPTRDVIVVDDGSRDETPSVVRDLGVRYVRTSGAGPSGARNAGLKLAETEFVAFLDDDDAWLPGNMAKQLTALQREPAAAFAFGRVQRTDEDLRPYGDPIPAAPLPSGSVVEFVSYYDLQLGALLFRRAALEEVDGFDPALRFTQDSDLIVRLAARYSAVGVDTVGSLFRQRAPNARDAAIRWPAHTARQAARRKWRRMGIRIPLRSRIQSDLNYRGMTSFSFCEDAAMAVRAGRRREAARSLLFALRVSPLHSVLGHRRFWSVLRLFAGAVSAH